MNSLTQSSHAQESSVIGTYQRHHLPALLLLIAVVFHIDNMHLLVIGWRQESTRERPSRAWQDDKPTKPARAALHTVVGFAMAIFTVVFMMRSILTLAMDVCPPEVSGTVGGGAVFGLEGRTVINGSPFHLHKTVLRAFPSKLPPDSSQNKKVSVVRRGKGGAEIRVIRTREAPSHGTLEGLQRTSCGFETGLPEPGLGLHCKKNNLPTLFSASLSPKSKKKTKVRYRPRRA